MKKIIPIVIVVVIIAAVGYRIFTRGNEEKVKSISEIQKEKGVPVEVVEVIQTDLNRTLHFNGTVEGIKQCNASAKISERIVKLSVEIGDVVPKGHIIARLDPESPQVQLSQAKLATEDAERELERMRALHQQGAISKQALDKYEFARDVARANLQQIEEILNVTAPIAGVVTDIFYREGETPPPSEPVVTIADMRKIKVKMEVSPFLHTELKKGQDAYIYLTTSPDIKVDGVVDKISLSADPESRNFQAYVVADNEDNYLQPGVSVEVEVVVGIRQGVAAIPRDGIFTKGDKIAVFVAEDTARMVEIKTGIESGSLVEVLSGLMPGQIVVVHGQNNLSEGDRLLIVNK